MMLGVILSLLLAITANSANILREDEKRDSSGDDKIKNLSNDQMQDLRNVYGVTPSRYGPFESGNLWQSEEVISGTNKPQVSARILVLNNGTCGRWSVWPTDKFYHWLGGKTWIDKIHPNGTRVSECLGSTVDDKDCRYVVKIPGGWFVDNRTTGKMAIIAAVVINGRVKGGANKSYECMMTTFGSQASTETSSRRRKNATSSSEGRKTGTFLENASTYV